jgi:hypothetical protein
VRDKIYIHDDGASPLFAERKRHADIVGYLGLKPEQFDNWIHTTADDLKPDEPMRHRDWEWQAFERGNWAR